MAFVQWLKYFFLSFFSNKIAAESGRRSMLNAVLSLALAITFVYFSLIGGAAASFGAFYNRSSDYKAFINNAFSQQAHDVVIEEGTAFSEYVNTYLNENDRQKYAVNGYNLIIDTREPRTTYNDFDTAYVKGETEISQEAYDKLSEAEKKDYTVKLIYTPYSLELTAEKTEEYVNWLTLNGGEEGIAELNKLKENGTVPESNYNLLYELYFKFRYPGAKGENYGNAPTMRTYYINTYLNSADYDKFLIILSDVAFTLFRTDDNVSYSVSGFYTGLDGLSASQDADSFINSLHKASIGMIAVNLFVNMATVLLLTIIIWLAVSLLASVAGLFCKFKPLRNFTGSMKASGAFALFGGITAAVISFITSFFLNINTVYLYTLVVMFAVIAVRMLIYTVCMLAAFKKGKIDGDGVPVYVQ